MYIILTTQENKDTIDAAHQFVCIGPNCWGIGQTAKEAHRNAKANAPHGYRGAFITRVAPKLGFGVDAVDGSVWWNEQHNAKDCPYCTVGKGIRINKE